MATAPESRDVLLLCGETIPGTPNIRVGCRISGVSCEELGYHEHADSGGWLIWNSESDFFVLGADEPTAWAAPPAKVA